MSEKDYILFSPVGTTDPISKNEIAGETKHFDGSMIHICRQYKPKHVVVYLTKEMHAREEEDQRFSKALKLLETDLCSPIELEWLPTDNYIKSAHDYEAFFDDFEKCLRRLHENNPDAEIILNVTSGTPAMTTALYLLANYLPFNMIPIQVETPARRANRQDWLASASPLEDLWKENLDNDVEQPNRCREMTYDNLNIRTTILHIKKLIDAYDYVAALMLARNIDECLSDEALGFLEAAVNRMQLNWASVSHDIASQLGMPFSGNAFASIDISPDKASGIFAEKLAAALAASDFEAEESADKQGDLTEYLLWLQVKCMRKDYSDFIRGITPALFRLFIIAVENVIGLPIRQEASIYIKERGLYRVERLRLTKCLEERGIPAPTIKKIEKSLFQKGSKKSFDDQTDLSSNVCAKIIKKLSETQELNIPSDKLLQLRKIEENLRNKAAHDIHGISDCWVKLNNDMHYDSGEIMRLIKECAETLALEGDGPILDIDWDSYSKMNQVIKDSL